MRGARLLVLGVALVAGLAAAYLAMQLVGRDEPAPVPAPQTAVVTQQPVAAPTVEILVAAADIPYGTQVTAAHLAWAAWPETVVNANPAYIRRSAQPQARTATVGLFAIGPIYRNEPILPQKLAESLSIAGTLPAGLRAAAVSVRASSTAGGFILPGDHVDVVLVTDGWARTILTDIRVLAIDQRTAAAEGSQTAVPNATATLALTPAQVEVIAGADGQIVLSLRSRSDAGTGAGSVAVPATPERTTVTVFGAGSRSTTSAEVPQP